jgi:hypothetical protein
MDYSADSQFRPRQERASGLGRMKVAPRLYLLVGCLLVLFVLFGFVAFNTLAYVQVNGPIYHSIIEGKDLVADVLPPPEYIIESNLTVLQMLNEKDPSRLAEMMRKLRGLKAQYDERHEFWHRTLHPGDLRNEMVVRAYEPAVRFYGVAEEKFLPAIGRRDLAAARALATGPLAQAYAEHRAAIDRVVELANERNSASELRAAQVIRDRTTMLVALGVLLVVGGLLLAWVLARATARPLGKVGSVITGFSADLASTVSQHERMAAQQAAAVSETTATMEELSASAQLSSEQADAASRGARQALELAREGGQTVELTIDGMNGLKERSAAIAEQILRLSERTSQIGSISRLVSDLANQTNLLAINAAVEAARAGEHGRGFGVVASEIRKLADQSKKSAERIDGLVGEIQQATNATVLAAEEGTKTVAEGTRLAHQTGAAFSELSQAIDQTFENIQQIALNARQQSIAVNQVVEAMNSLNAGAQETAGGLSQTKMGIERLDEASRELAVLV